MFLRKNFLFSFALESTNRYPFLDLKATFIRAKPAKTLIVSIGLWAKQWRLVLVMIFMRLWRLDAGLVLWQDLPYLAIIALACVLALGLILLCSL